jgi:hypothetical protein
MARKPCTYSQCSIRRHKRDEAHACMRARHSVSCNLAQPAVTWPLPRATYDTHQPESTRRSQGLEKQDAAPLAGRKPMRRCMHAASKNFRVLGGSVATLNPSSGIHTQQQQNSSHAAKASAGLQAMRHPCKNPHKGGSFPCPGGSLAVILTGRQTGP